jgi:gliding motility-associated-like protein
MKKYILFCLALSSVIVAKAQMFYYCDTMTIGFPNGQVYHNVPTWGTFDLENCNDTVPFALFSPILVTDCTVHPNGKLYGTGYHIFDNTGQGIHEIRFFWGTGSIEKLISFDHDSLEALTCTPTGQIYGAGKGLSLIDIDSNTITYLGDFPPGVRAGGDLAFYKGQLYMTTATNSMVAVDIESPSNSVVAWTFPDTIPTIQGLVSNPITCDSSVIYAVGSGVDDRMIYRVDFEGQSLIPACNPGRFILGAAAFNECLIPPCTITIDSDEDNSTGSFPFGYLSDTVCSTPIAIVDEDVNIICDRAYLDSVTLKLTDILNPGEEYLETAFSGSGLTVHGSGTQSLRIESNQSVPISVVEEALKSITYRNNAVNVELGPRKIEIIAWIESNQSEVAVTIVNLSNNLSSPIYDVSEISCFGEQDGEVQVIPQGGQLPFGFFWGNGETAANIQGQSTGYLYVTITESTGCSIIDSVFVPQPDSLVSFIAATGETPYCEGNTVLVVDIGGGTAPYEYSWDTGAQDSVVFANASEVNNVTITDSHGCTSISTLTLQLTDTVLVLEAHAICQGETYNWKGNLISTDTIVCMQYSLPNGCDSTTCLALTVNPLPQPQITVDGTLCNGNEAELSVGSGFELVEWSTGAVGPSINVGSEGTYWATVTNSFGCSASTSAVIAPVLAFNLVVADPSCFGRSDGGIFIDPMSGTPPYQFSLNGTDFTADGLFENLPAGDYLPSLKDATGCELGNQVELTEPPPLSINAGPDASILVGESIELNATASPSNLSVSWQPTDFLDCAVCASPTATPPYSIEYTATVSFGNGCEASDTVSVTVEESGAYYVPTAFSPNGDGYNDWFTVFGGRSVARIVSMEIYDRKGGLAFSVADVPANQEEKGWNGRIGEEEAQSGVFTYKLLLEFVSGKVETVTGTVVLLR